MAHVKFFLDTNVLMALAGLKESNLQDFKNRIETNNFELSTTHVQVDEITKHIKFHESVKEKHEKKVQTYQQKIKEALKSLENKGIVIHVNPTQIFVVGVSRVNYGVLGSEEIGKLYDELRREIDECQKSKRRPKPPLNIYRDATIAVSSLGHEFFITSDKCLFDSWHKVISKHELLRQQFKIPRVIYTRRCPSEVAKRILEHLDHKQ